MASHTPVDQEWFKEYLEEKFNHVETKLKALQSVSDATFEQATITNGKVKNLEEWRSKQGGIWKGVSVTIMVVAGVVGAVFSAIVQYLWGR